MCYFLVCSDLLDGMKYEGLVMLNIQIYFQTLFASKIERLLYTSFVYLCHDVDKSFMGKHGIHRHNDNKLTWLRVKI